MSPPWAAPCSVAMPRPPAPAVPATVRRPAFTQPLPTGRERPAASMRSVPRSPISPRRHGAISAPECSGAVGAGPAPSSPSPPGRSRQERTGITRPTLGSARRRARCARHLLDASDLHDPFLFCVNGSCGNGFRVASGTNASDLTQRQFPPPSDRPREHQVRRIGTRNQQHQPHRCHQHSRKRRHVSAERPRHQLQRKRAGFKSRRICIAGMRLAHQHPNIPLRPAPRSRPPSAVQSPAATKHGFLSSASSRAASSPSFTFARYLVPVSTRWTRWTLPDGGSRRPDEAPERAEEHRAGHRSRSRAVPAQNHHPHPDHRHPRLLDARPDLPSGVQASGLGASCCSSPSVVPGLVRVAGLQGGRVGLLHPVGPVLTRLTTRSSASWPPWSAPSRWPPWPCWWAPRSPSAPHSSSASTPRLGPPSADRHDRPGRRHPQHHLRPVGRLRAGEQRGRLQHVAVAPLCVHPVLQGEQPAR